METYTPNDFNHLTQGGQAMSELTVSEYEKIVNEAEDTAPCVQRELPCYARPKTRGELRNLLVKGVSCEVVSSNVEITSAMLSGWLDFDKFTVRKSENKGWSIFEA